MREKSSTPATGTGQKSLGRYIERGAQRIPKTSSILLSGFVEQQCNRGAGSRDKPTLHRAWNLRKLCRRERSCHPRAACQSSAIDRAVASSGRGRITRAWRTDELCKGTDQQPRE